MSSNRIGTWGIINDTHWGARNDSATFRDYFTKFYDEVFFPYIDEHEIKTVFHLGDVFDRRKFVNYVTANAFYKHFLKPCLDRGITIYAIPGNHDCPYVGTNRINSVTEILREYDGRVNVYPGPTEIKVDGVDILMVPWINDENRDETMKKIAQSQARVLFGHLEPKGFSMYKNGMVNQDGVDPKHFSSFDVVCSGHYHHKSSKKNFHMLHAPYEITWNDYDDVRGFHVMDPKDLEPVSVPNPLKMFHKVFYNDMVKTIEEVLDNDFSHLKNTYVKVITEKKERPDWFDMFIEKIQEAGPIQVIPIDEDIRTAELTEEDLAAESEDTITLLNRYVDETETDTDKEALKGLLGELYKEAQEVVTY